MKTLNLLTFSVLFDVVSLLHTCSVIRWSSRGSRNTNRCRQLVIIFSFCGIHCKTAHNVATGYFLFSFAYAVTGKQQILSNFLELLRRNPPISRNQKDYSDSVA